MTNPAIKLDVLIVHYAYGGNGGIQSEHPSIREWEVETIRKMDKDPRVGPVKTITFSDTPICMLRNRAVTTARSLGCHLLLQIDSDQDPGRHKGEPGWRPFWDVAFDEIYNHYQRGPLCLFAPYCGPPPHENVYVFRWENDMVVGDSTRFRLEQYTRFEAATMRGVQEAAAGPTGMMLTDMRCFDITQPSGRDRRFILEDLVQGKITVAQAERELHDGWFYYEWENNLADQKASTEDVTFTRDLSLAGQAILGYNPLRCCWDSWIGHHKPWNVGKPAHYTVENIGSVFQRALLDNHSSNDCTAKIEDVIADVERRMRKGERMNLPVL